MNLLHKIALALEATADYIDKSDIEKATKSEEKIASDPSIEVIFKEAFGKEIDPNTLEKISSDPSLKETFMKMADSMSAAQSLGEPSDKNDQNIIPTTKQERSKLADDRFKSWILDD